VGQGSEFGATGVKE
jgi:hypothetical protein